MIYYGSMKMFHRVLGGWTLALAAFHVPAQTPPAPPAAAKAAAPEQSPLTARLLYELLIGEMLFRQGDTQNGAAYVLSAARRTGDAELFKRAAQMAIQSRSGPAALETVRAWRDAHPNTVEAGQYELQVLIALGRVAETEVPLRQFVSTLPESDRLSPKTTSRL